MDIKRINKTHVLQYDQTDCGVACLLSIIRYYNGNQNIDYLRKISGTTIQGTTLLGLYQAAVTLGFNANGIKSNINHLKLSKSPSILHVTINNYPHYITYYGYNQKKGFLIGDPSKGIIFLNEKTLNEIWTLNVCLELIPNISFNKSLEKEKKKLYR
ncbi:cysteine peptidase family C39 domain-containing protein [Myroides odoratus]|uniref:cysteine peptidase family C39 domain-containing protein n=1 Tax=Myroides odoratus TaxID=256 RepID=UPI003341E3DD